MLCSLSLYIELLPYVLTEGYAGHENLLYAIVQQQLNFIILVELSELVLKN